LIEFAPVGGNQSMDYKHLMRLISGGEIPQLEAAVADLDDFPCGKDDLVGRRWLTNAIDCGTPEVVEWMLTKGASPVFDDAGGYSVLHSVIERERPDKYRIMRMLIAGGADLNARGINDWTPAHMAAARNDVEALKILYEAGADLALRTRIDEYATPLNEARHLGRSPDAVAFLEKVTAPSDEPKGALPRS
jgi:ankyrin repeat protein